MIPVGLVGTSGWSDLMYIPALKEHPDGKIVAICGQNRERAQELADRWGIPHVFTDYNALIESGLVQAVMVITPNHLHYPMTMKALEAGLHVLCDKPLAMNYREARQMADLAAQKGVRQLVSFTWSFMPSFRFVKELVDGGYIGKPYSLNMRWCMNYLFGADYRWRMDRAKAGSGAVGEIGAHYFYIASSLFGRIASVSCQLGYFEQRPQLDDKGKPFDRTDDVATIMLQFENGAQGSLHMSAITPKEYPQQLECYGSDGTLSSVFGFEAGQHIYGARASDEGGPQELSIPDHIWNGARRDSAFETFQDVFYKQDSMARHFISSIAANTPAKPDFQDAADVQRVIDAALKKAMPNAAGWMWQILTERAYIMDAAAIVQEAEDAYNAQDIDRVRDLFHPAIVVYWGGKKLLEGRDELVAFEARNFASWTNFKMTKTLWAASGDKIAVEWKCSYTEKDSGDFVEIVGAEFWTMRDNQRIEWRAYSS